MKRKMMLLLTMTMILGVVLTGCRKGTPEDQMQRVEKQLMEAKTTMGRLEGEMKISGGGLGIDATLGMDTKLDFSRGFVVAAAEGEVGAMGMKTQLKAYLDEQVLYFKAVGSEQVQPIDDEMRRQIVSDFQGRATGAAAPRREIQRSYQGKDQVLTAKYDVAALNEQLRTQGEQTSTSWNDEMTSFLKKQAKSMGYQAPQLVFDQAEVSYVLDRKERLQAIRGALSCNVMYRGEVLSLQLQFNYRIDQLGGEIDIEKPSYTTQKTTQKTEKNLEKSAEEDSEKEDSEKEDSEKDSEKDKQETTKKNQDEQ